MNANKAKVQVLRKVLAVLRTQKANDNDRIDLMRAFVKVAAENPTLRSTAFDMHTWVINQLGVTDSIVGYAIAVLGFEKVFSGNVAQMQHRTEIAWVQWMLKSAR